MFNLSSQLDEQVEAHLNRLRGNGWLTFKGLDAIDLLRKVLIAQPKPHLIAHCHHTLAADPVDLEFFIPSSVKVIPRSRKVEIKGRYRGPHGAEATLYWDPETQTHPSGTFLSSISTLKSCYPESTIAGITIPPLKF